MESFSGYLREMRLKCGLSLRDMAARLDVSATYYADVEKGRRYPMDLERLKRFGSVAGMSREELNRLLDLAGSARGTVAPDVAAYIAGRECVRAALRTACDVQAGCADWERFTDWLRERYDRLEE